MLEPNCPDALQGTLACNRGRRSGIKIFATILAAALPLCGCASGTYVPVEVVPPARAVDSLAIGDNARILTTDGREISTVVTSIDGDVIVGMQQRISVEDVAGVAILQEPDYQAAEISRVVWAYVLNGFLVSLAL